MRKRPYDLDYTIPDAQSRTEYVSKLIANLETKLTPSDLEQLGDYIIYGKDTNGQNAVQRGETLDTGRRHKETYRKLSERNESLDQLMELGEGIVDQHAVPADMWGVYTHPHTEIRRPFKRPDGTTDQGDSRIPGMRDLWRRIDKLEYTIQANEGKVPLKPTTPIVNGGYAMYKLKHLLVELYREQYTLKDAYNPPIKSRTASRNYYTPPVNMSEDTGYWLTEKEWRKKLKGIYNPRISRNIDDYKTKVNKQGVWVWWEVSKQSFDWENRKHIRALMEHWDLLESQDGTNPDSWGYTLLKDFEFYRRLAKFSPMREYLVDRRLARANYLDLVGELEEKFGVTYNTSYLCRVLTYELPTAIAKAATKYRIINSTPKEKYKVCSKCGESYPPHSIFFGICATAEDGLTNVCRECDRKRRHPEEQNIAGGSYRDQRKKDQTMHTMQTGETNTQLSAKQQ